MKKIFLLLSYSIFIPFFLCIKGDKQEVMQKEDVDKLLQRFYSNRFTFDDKDTKGNKTVENFPSSVELTHMRVNVL